MCLVPLIFTFKNKFVTPKLISEHPYNSDARNGSVEEANALEGYFQKKIIYFKVDVGKSL